MTSEQQLSLVAENFALRVQVGSRWDVVSRRHEEQLRLSARSENAGTYVN